MYTDLLKRYPIISDQVNKAELTVILRELQKVLDKNVDGDVVELGCYEGTTSLFLQRMLQKQDKNLYVYDSFAGLPSKDKRDISPAGDDFKAGELSVAKSQLIKNFKQAGLPLPIIKKGWFEQLDPECIPKKIAFAFLDGDFYTSTICSLKLIWPYLADDAVVIIDDYQTEALPGVAAAVQEWSQKYNFNLRVESSLAIIYLTR